MRVKHRIVLLNSGLYAIQKKLSVFGLSPFGWEFICVPHPDVAGLVETFATVKDAENYFVDPMDVRNVVKELP